MLEDVRNQFQDCYLGISSTDEDSLDHYEANEYWPSIPTIFKRKFPRSRGTFWSRLSYAFHHVLFRLRINIFIGMSMIEIYPYFLSSKEMASIIKLYNKFDLFVECRGYLLQPDEIWKIAQYS